MDGQIIDLVGKKRFLYDKKEKLYRNNKIKAEAWKNIAEELGTGVDVLEKRWKSLRDQFSRELKRRNNKSSGSAGSPPRMKFKYYERLLFLKDTYTPRKYFVIQYMF